MVTTGKSGSEATELIYLNVLEGLFPSRLIISISFPAFSIISSPCQSTENELTS